MKIINARSDDLYVENFEARPGQLWCVIGGNRSGMDSFFKLISKDKTDIRADCLELPESSGNVCFKNQQALYESELRIDDTDYLGRIDPGTPAKNFIKDYGQYEELIESFGMTGCMERGYRQLSTGQSRKLMMLSQISKGRSVLMIQAPFDGLDSKGRMELSDALEVLYHRKILILLFVYNIEDIPCFCTHVAFFRDKKIECMGPVDDILGMVESQFKTSEADLKPLVSVSGDPVKPENNKSQLVCLQNGEAGYGGKKVFQNISLTVFQGDHTLITGPNGCGKSTLLHLITGDHPACYQNDLKVFGMRRGTGESIWDIKKKMGIVSPELHRNYYIPGALIHCVLSGLFDSIGLYRSYTRQQEIQAMQWLDQIGLADKAKFPFRRLSHSDQRLALIVRAMIKQPELLIMDEPTQGLDEANRYAVLDFLESMILKTNCTILFVSHRADEFRSFFRQHLDMDIS